MRLSLLLLCPSLAVAAPHDAPLHGRNHDPTSLRTLSDNPIGKDWSIPEKHADLGTHADAADPLRTPESDSLALYGSDVVLRFTIRTADEATSLSKASRTLSLDVWESNADWVDIRLSEDTVSPIIAL